SLYVGIYAPIGEEDTHDFAEVATMQNAAEGRIKQIGVYTQEAFTTAQVTALQAICDTLAAEHKPLSAVLVADISGLTLTSLGDLRSLSAPNVSVLIGQDAGGTGAELYVSEGVTIGALGACIGAVAKASVHESIAWVGKFPVGGAELDSVGFGEGTAINAVTKTQLDELDTKGYIFLQKHVGYP